MPIIEFHFTYPQSLTGDFIIYRTGDDYSHSWIVLNGKMYDPLPIFSKSHQPPIDVGDLIYHLEVSQETFDVVEKYCNDWVGTFYDFLGVFGWLIGIGNIQNSKHTYCHEFCHAVLALAVDVDKSHTLISASHLIDELHTHASIITE